MKILLLSRYSSLGASSRLRFFQYLPFLNCNGIEVDVAPLFPDYYLDSLYLNRSRNVYVLIKLYFNRIKRMLEMRKYSLVWIEKELLPWFPFGFEHLFLKKLPYIVDYDDAIFHNYDIHKVTAVRLLLGRKIDKIMKNASVVIVGNAYLAERAHLAGSRQVEIIPTVIDLNHYIINEDNKQSNDVFNIGWIGSPVTLKYLLSIQDILKKISVDCKVKVMIISSAPINLPGVLTEFRKWAESSEVSNIGSFDVGIMPLSKGPWELGKCGYKLIQYMACAKPVVASPVGSNCEIVNNGVNGFLAEDTNDWIAHLKYLYNNRDASVQMGKQGRALVESSYCIQVTGPRILNLLRKAGKYAE